MFQQCLLSTALESRSLGGGEAVAAAGRNVKQNECQITAVSSEGKVKVIRARAREVKNELIESTRLSGEAESEGCRRERRNGEMSSRRDVAVPARAAGSLT